MSTFKQKWQVESVECFYALSVFKMRWIRLLQALLIPHNNSVRQALFNIFKGEEIDSERD